MTGELSTGPARVAANAKSRFVDIVGAQPEGLWAAPGRVNLIGEHTDYNAGLALPFAIDRATVIAARRRTDGLVRIHSTTLDGQATAALRDLSAWAPATFAPWARYPLGVVWCMARSGTEVPGLDLVISSDVPLGSGLSSSGALTVGVAVAVADLSGSQLSHVEAAKIAQSAESSFAGAPTGLLDQLASLEGRAGSAVLIDFSSMETELVTITAGPLVVVNTRVERANAGGAYADRRRTCEMAAAKLGVPTLRQAELARVETELDGDLRKRARHIVTENGRVRETAERLHEGRPVGELLVSSHISLRDDYEVSCPQLDLAVETALARGAEGARLTGAGLGGCAISLGVDASDLETVVSKAFEEAGFEQPEVFAVTPADGAGRLE
ncbi:MAG TPA: galactokinase [Acidimicrobiales bacterium]|nr:galactokinase [Acidimicrobiales bacterium]